MYLLTVVRMLQSQHRGSRLNDPQRLRLKEQRRQWHLGEKLVAIWARRPPHWVPIGSLLSTPGSAYKLVCYFTSWSQDRQEPGKFTLESADPFLCSHLIYSFASISDNKVVIKDKNDAMLYQTIKSLKTKSVAWEWGAHRP